MFEPISKYGNYFCGVDGEGVGNDYVLLDSSMDDYPRLYSASGALRVEEILDWTWNLGKFAGYCIFAFFGANYDFNNFLRTGLDFEGVKRYANSQPVRVGNYIILWRERFVYEIRKIRDEDTSKEEFSNERYAFERIAPRNGSYRADKMGMQLWDVAPFWQTTFVKALDMTLPKERQFDRELIEAGKEARGTFTHENIEWVSKYNKAECYNLAYMCVELDNWFHEVGIKPLHYNGPGSAAKAAFRTYQPYLHAGRKIDHKQRSIAKKVREYTFPGADSDRNMLWRVLSAYAGGLNRVLKIGYHRGDAKAYDIISCHPFGLSQVPCLTHGEWERTRTFNPKRFGLWRIRYRSSRKLSLYPFFWRSPDGSIEYPYSFEERWAHTCEVAAGIAIDPNGVEILDGWIWNPYPCDNPNPFWWIRKFAAQREYYKSVNNEGASNGLKLPMNSAYGSTCQARGGSFTAPPWTQQLLWAGFVTAYSRTRLQLAYHLNPDAIVHMATDGIISLEPLPIKIGKKLGEWEESNLEDLTVIQHGMYRAMEWKEVDGQRWGTVKHRERGFRLNDDKAEEFVNRVHEFWLTGQWKSVEVEQRIFVTAKLVAQSEARFEEWCTWKDVTKTVEIDMETLFQSGIVNQLDHMVNVEDVSRTNLKNIGKSTPYEPKWGKGEDFPMEWKLADAMEEAQEISVA
jgi:hypothetical protein